MDLWLREMHGVYRELVLVSKAEVLNVGGGEH